MRLRTYGISLAALAALALPANAGGQMRAVGVASSSSQSMSMSSTRSYAGSTGNTTTTNVGGTTVNNNISDPPAPAYGGNGWNWNGQAPSVFAPGLTGSACQGSISFGASGPMAGLTFGATTENAPCNVRADAQMLWAMNHKAAARRVLCTDGRFAYALGRRICPSAPLAYGAATGPAP